MRRIPKSTPPEEPSPNPEAGCQGPTNWGGRRGPSSTGTLAPRDRVRRWPARRVRDRGDDGEGPSGAAVPRLCLPRDNTLPGMAEEAAVGGVVGAEGDEEGKQDGQRGGQHSGARFAVGGRRGGR